MKYLLQCQNVLLTLNRKQRSLESLTHETCDVILRCGRLVSVPVHSSVLSAVSYFFRRLLSGQAVKSPNNCSVAIGIVGGALDVVTYQYNFTAYFQYYDSAFYTHEAFHDII